MIRTNSQPGRRRYYSRYIAHYTKKNYSLILLGGMFLAGLLLGTLLLRTAGDETVELLLRLVNGYLDKKKDQSLLQNFTSSAASSLLFVGVLFVCGFCAISQPVSVLAPLFRGLGAGFSIASMYAVYGSDAVGFVAVLILPGMTLSTLAILLCCRESLRLSGSFFQAMNAESGKEFYSLQIYLARYLACGFLCVLAAFLESVLYFAFANSFFFG